MSAVLIYWHTNLPFAAHTTGACGSFVQPWCKNADGKNTQHGTLTTQETQFNTTTYAMVSPKQEPQNPEVRFVAL